MMADEKYSQTTADQPYNKTFTTKELEERVFEKDAVEAAAAMEEKSARLEQEYRSIGREYEGIIGRVAQLLDEIGVTKYQDRLKKRIAKSKLTARELEMVIEENTRESARIVKQQSEVRTKSSFAGALMRRYEKRTVEVDELIEQKTQAYNAAIEEKGAAEDFGYESIAKEINELRADKFNLQNDYNRAAAVIHQCKQTYNGLVKKKAIIDRQLTRSRISLLNGCNMISNLELYVDEKISPHQVAKLIRTMEEESGKMNKLNRQLDTLSGETFDNIGDHNVELLTDPSDSEETQKMVEMVERENNIIAAEAKKVMESERYSL